jgi:hypothetical protein
MQELISSSFLFYNSHAHLHFEEEYHRPIARSR